MSEQRFTIQKASGMYLHLPIFDNDVEMADGDVCILLNEQQATIKDLGRKLQICSAHLLSDECCLTDGQIRKIIKEMENE